MGLALQLAFYHVQRPSDEPTLFHHSLGFACKEKFSTGSQTGKSSQSADKHDAGGQQLVTMQPRKKGCCRKSRMFTSSLERFNLSSVEGRQGFLPLLHFHSNTERQKGRRRA